MPASSEPRPGRTRRPSAYAAEGTEAGRPLPLLAQYDYTTGGCATFAEAAHALFGGKLALLFAKEPEQFEEHDHPTDEPLCLHAFVLLPDGMAIDAEGIRPVRELARGFGVREGWDYSVSEGKRAFRTEFTACTPEAEATARALMEEHGWRGGVPAADESLARRWREVQVMRAERAGCKREPTPRQIRLYGLVPGCDVGCWDDFERLEIREHAEHAYVVVAVPDDPLGDELVLTGAGDLETAEEIACEIETETGLDFDLDATPGAPGLR